MYNVSTLLIISMENNTHKDTAINFLKERNRLTAVIATVSDDGSPHAAVIYYFVDEDFNFYFLTATNTRKYKHLLANPRASITTGFGPKYTTIQGDGTTALLTKGSDEENHAIALIKVRLQEHDNTTWPIFQLEEFEDESIAVFKFVPDSLQLLNLEQNNGLKFSTDDIQKII